MEKGKYYYIEFIDSHKHLNGKYKVVSKTEKGVFFLIGLKDWGDITANETEIKRFIELYYF